MTESLFSLPAIIPVLDLGDVQQIAKNIVIYAKNNIG